MARTTRHAGVGNALGWTFGLLVLAIGVANLLLVHPVPASVYGLVSLVYFPPVNTLIRARLGKSIPPFVKVVLAVVVAVFTLGVSDLGDMVD